MFLSQILASTVKNILLLDLGLALCFSTIVIPALTGDDKEHNPDEFLHITPEQASWLGKIYVIYEAFASKLVRSYNIYRSRIRIIDSSSSLNCGNIRNNEFQFITTQLMHL